MLRQDRQRSILETINARLYETIPNLDHELRASRNTVRNDLTELTDQAAFCSECEKKDGRVYAADGWYYSEIDLTDVEEKALREVAPRTAAGLSTAPERSRYPWQTERSEELKPDQIDGGSEMSINGSSWLKKPETQVSDKDTGQDALCAIYVCSPYRANSKSGEMAEDEINRNTRRAILASQLVTKLGYMPMVPHLYFPQFLDDSVKAEREQGIEFGLRWLEHCRELWAFGDFITEGMSKEIARAKELGIPVRMMPEPEHIIKRIIDYLLEKEIISYGKNGQG